MQTISARRPPDHATTMLMPRIIAAAAVRAQREDNRQN